MIFANQAVGLSKNKKTVRSYMFTKEEFQAELVPPYAYDLKETVSTQGMACVTFQCAFNQFGEPICVADLQDKK